MSTGTLKFWSLNGYGFAEVDGVLGDVFIHKSSLPKDYEPNKGDILSFDVITTADGRLRAQNVSV